MLLFTASEIESATVAMGVSPAVGGLLGGMGGGIAQAYATMGVSSCSKSHGGMDLCLADAIRSIRFLHMHEDR